MMIIIIKHETCFQISVEEKRMKLLVFTLHFWLKRSRGKNNNKNDNNYDNTNTR